MAWGGSNGGGGILVVARRLGAIGLSCGCLFGAAAPASAAPANDAWAAAEPLNEPLPASASGTNVGATVQNGEPGVNPGGTVWYGWTPATSRRVRIDVCNPSPLRDVDVFLGSDTPLSPPQFMQWTMNGNIDLDDDSQDCRFVLNAVTGHATPYWIAVSGHPQGAFDLSVRNLNSPANDDVLASQDLGSAFPVALTGTNVDSLLELAEPWTGTSVWYRWTAPSSGPVAIDACNEDVPAMPSVYTGEPVGGLGVLPYRELAQVAGPESCRLAFRPTQGVTYRIAIATDNDSSDWRDHEGEFPLSIETADPPPNDLFANAQNLGSGRMASASGDNFDATPDEAQGWDGKSVWYRWTAPSTDWVTADVCDADFDARGEIYEGSSIGNLVNRGSMNCHSQFGAVAGTTYLFRIAGDEEGSFFLDLYAPPANDDVATAETLALPASSPGYNRGATPETSEPFHLSGLEPEYSAWYRWRSPGTGPVIVDTCASDFDSVVAVYFGLGDFGTLSRLGENDDSPSCAGANPAGSSVGFQVQAGSEYWIAVDGWDTGTFTLNMRAAGPHTYPVTACPKGKRLQKGKCVKRKKKKQKRKRGSKKR